MLTFICMSLPFFNLYLFFLLLHVYGEDCFELVERLAYCVSHSNCTRITTHSKLDYPFDFWGIISFFKPEKFSDLGKEQFDHFCSYILQKCMIYFTFLMQ